MDELVAALETLGFPVYDTDATGASLQLEDLPYLLVFGTEGDPSGQRSLYGAESTDEITVRHVGASAQQVRIAAKRTRTLLGNARIAGVSYILDEAREVVTDTSVYLTGTQRHPVFLDHVWRAWN